MIRKFAICMLFLAILSGCVQSVASLGPIFSYVQSGSIAQSALSYGSNKAFNKIKNKSKTKTNENTYDDSRVLVGDSTSLLIKKR